MSRNADGSAPSLAKSPTDLAHELMPVFFSPLARGLERLNISPNTITVIGAGLALLGGAALALDRRYAALVLIVLSGFMDGMDGLLARQTQRTTRFGAFLDSVLDRWADSAILIGLSLHYLQLERHTEVVLASVALAASLLVSYTRARAEGVGAQCRRGLFTRLERFITLVTGLVLNQMTIALWVWATLSLFTAGQRIYYTWKYIRENLED